MTFNPTIGVLLSAVMVLGGCEQSKPNVDTSMNKPPVSNPAQDNPTQVTTRLPDPAFGGVDGVNGVTSPTPGTVIPINGDKIDIAGNYVDAVKGEAAAGVIVMIDKTPFVATYGGERPDIAKALNNPKYLKSQFHVEVPTSAVGKGIHDLRIRVIASDKSGYYESGSIATLNVK